MRRGCPVVVVVECSNDVAYKCCCVIGSPFSTCGAVTVIAEYKLIRSYCQGSLGHTLWTSTDPSMGRRRDKRCCVCSKGYSMPSTGACSEQEGCRWIEVPISSVGNKWQHNVHSTRGHSLTQSALQSHTRGMGMAQEQIHFLAIYNYRSYIITLLTTPLALLSVYLFPHPSSSATLVLDMWIPGIVLVMVELSIYLWWNRTRRTV